MEVRHGHAQNEWDLIAELQDDRFGENGDMVRQGFYDPIVRKLLGNVEGKVILDAGCGNGYWVRRLSREKADTVIGIDYSRALLDLARKKEHSINVLYSEMNLADELGIRSNSIDAIICNVVLDYVPSIDVFAGESFRILRHSGVLVMGVQHPLHHRMAMLKDLDGTYNRYVGYFEQVPIVKKTYEGNAEVTIHNRTVSGYINPFIKLGLSLVDILEPPYPDSFLEQCPSFKNKNDIPRFLILKFQKL